MQAIRDILQSLTDMARRTIVIAYLPGSSKVWYKYKGYIKALVYSWDGFDEDVVKAAQYAQSKGLENFKVYVLPLGCPNPTSLAIQQRHKDFEECRTK